MKILELRKKIIVNFSITAALAIVLSTVVFFNFHQKSALKSKTDQINSETSQIQGQAGELQSKAIEIKKYMSMWDNINESKKNTNGIKMEEVNATLNTVASKYSITDHTIKVTLPETLKDGVFSRKTITVLFTTANLNFRAINDIKALSFVNEFIDSIPGYPVITNLEIKKDKNYSTEDLIAISSGKGSGMIVGKVDFVWYAFRENADRPKDKIKSNETKPTQVPNAKPTP